MALLLAAIGGPPEPAAAAEGDVVLECAADAATVKLGEDVVLRLTVTNRGASAVDLPAIRLAKDAVSVDVSWPAAAGAPAPQVRTQAVVTRLIGTFAEDDLSLRFVQKATPTRRLGAGESLRGTVTFAAVVPGDLTCTAHLGADGPTRLSARPVVVAVEPRSGPGRRLLLQTETTGGTFTVELDGAGAFNSVSHAWRLAREGFHDQTRIHRIEPRLLVQGGCPRGDGTGGPGWTLPAEGPVRPPGRGDFGLARAAHPDSAGSQWFAVADAAGDAGTLRAEWTPLGKVVEGQDVVDALAAGAVDPATQAPVKPVQVTAVRAVVR